MNALAMPFRQLVERRLWPVAVLLLAAVAAVFLVLSKDEAPAPAPTAVASTAGQGATQPIVSAVEPGTADAERKVLGSRKNPFRPAIKAKKAREAAVGQSPAGGPTPIQVETPPTGGASPTTGGPSPTTVSPLPGITVPTVPAPTFELYSLIVRFGDSSGELSYRAVKRLKGLPGGASPKLMYLGLLSDRRTAVFLVDAGVTVQGDGTCRPTPDDCQTLRLRAGDTVFIDVPRGDGASKQYQLDLVKVVSRKTKDAVAARKARAAVAGGGRDALRARVSRVGNLKYSVRTGTLKRVAAKPRKARMAGAGMAAAG